MDEGAGLPHFPHRCGFIIFQKCSFQCNYIFLFLSKCMLCTVASCVLQVESLMHHVVYLRILVPPIFLINITPSAHFAYLFIFSNGTSKGTIYV